MWTARLRKNAFTSQAAVKTLFCLLFSFTLITPIKAQAAVDESLVLWMEFEDDPSNGLINDSSSYGNHGTCSGTSCPVLTADRNGNPDSAYQFDGVDDYIDLPDGLEDSLNDFTFTAWVNWTGTRNWERIFDFGSAVTPDQTTGEYLFLTPMSWGNKLQFSITLGGWGNDQALTGTNNLLNRGWTHAAVTLEGDTGKLYLNGSLDSNASITLNPSQIGAVNNWLGRSQYAVDPYFNGALDEVRLYSRALSQEEIQALYQGVPPLPDTTPPVISSVSSSSLETEAVIQWMTDEPSTSLARYGLDPSLLDGTEEDLTLKTNHSLSLQGLTSGAAYHYEVLSVDAGGNQAKDNNGGSYYQFTTSIPPPNQPPTASFTISPPQPSAGTAAAFDASGSSDPDQDPLTYTWNFGDNTPIASGEVVLHTYTQEGAYTVTLTVGDGRGGSDTLEKALTVTPFMGGALPMLTASRTSGVGPLAVFFDAVDVASGVVQPIDGDYAALHYAWDFGDPLSGFWSTDSKSKNAATGYVAAHVFENPGTYTVRLTVTQPGGQTVDYQQAITVDDPNVVFEPPNGTTYYVSSSGGSDSNSGLSDAQAFASWSQGINTLLSSPGPRRVLFRRGDTFNSDFNLGSQNNKVGPYIIGAFGIGTNPVIQNTGTHRTLSFGSSSSGVRIVDVDFKGPSPITTTDALSLGPDSLVLRSHISNHNNGIVNSGNNNRVFVIDSVFLSNEGWGMYHNWGRNIGILGCEFDTGQSTDPSHLLRSYITRSVINHCTFQGGGSAKHQLKFIGYRPTDARPTAVVEYCVISDNRFMNAGAWKITIGPQDNINDERVENVIFERNLISGTKAGVGVILNARYVTLRNNVFVSSPAGSTFRAISIFRRGIEPSPLGNKVYNNTAYRPDDGGSNGLIFCNIDGSTADTIVRNNLASAPNAGNPIMISGSGSGLIASNNLLTNTPGFANPGGGDFHLLVTSPAIDAGMAVPGVITDWDGVSRPVDGPDPDSVFQWDIGAFEYAEAAPSVRYGDVDDNGKVQAYDASLVLQHVVGLIQLTPDQQVRADVDGTSGVTLNDASYILMYVVDLIDKFPVEG